MSVSMVALNIIITPFSFRSLTTPVRPCSRRAACIKLNGCHMCLPDPAPRGRRGAWTPAGNVVHANGYAVVGCQTIDVASLRTVVRPAAAGDIDAPTEPLTAALESLPLPELLRLAWPERFVSASAARRACRRSLVLVDGCISSCSTQVSGSVTLELLGRVSAPAPGEGRRGATDNSLAIAYEDDDLAIVFKPAGVPVQGAHDERTSMRTLLVNGLAPSGAEDPLWRPQHVHRLDAPTSGLLVVAKSRSALRELSAAFAERRVRKTYRAVVAGAVHLEHREISDWERMAPTDPDASPDADARGE
eukprot:CAMPEP_0183339662 /NCGR_PEP_ID=MMETSP0164_2-20130417/6505_1 /TAXON_ID=221442 /ORGANISM="Coccolithus pelagicus ssp braarudi, Strain PLY182g" /LENGTH=303 /DNA_ID=CAMNT_0025509693 /DNA_START=139 /DNA_END=1047 /DNA_ORIENTATION=-